MFVFYLCFPSFLYFIECVCRIQFQDMCVFFLSTCRHPAQRRSFVNTKLVYLLGLKNRHGHWLWWMSTGRKNGLMWRTHTHTRFGQKISYTSKASIESHAWTPDRLTSYIKFVLKNARYIYIYFFSHPIHYLRTSCALSPSNS